MEFIIHELTVKRAFRKEYQKMWGRNIQGEDVDRILTF